MLFPLGSLGAHRWEVNLQFFSSPAPPFTCCYWGNSCCVVSTRVTLLCLLSIPEVVTKYSNFISFPLYLNGRRINTLQVRWRPQAGQSWRWISVMLPWRQETAQSCPWKPGEDCPGYHRSCSDQLIRTKGDNPAEVIPATASLHLLWKSLGDQQDLYLPLSWIIISVLYDAYSVQAMWCVSADGIALIAGVLTPLTAVLSVLYME